VQQESLAPEDFSKENFPVFIGCMSDERKLNFYGIPIHEYPGLIKVRECFSFCEDNMGFIFQVAKHWLFVLQDPHTLAIPLIKNEALQSAL